MSPSDSMPLMPDYANRGQNFPMITAARGGHHAGTVDFTLTSTPASSDDIEFMVSPSCDASGHGQGASNLYYRNGVTGTVTLPSLGANGKTSAIERLRHVLRERGQHYRHCDGLHRRYIRILGVFSLRRRRHLRQRL